MPSFSTRCGHRGPCFVINANLTRHHVTVYTLKAYKRLNLNTWKRQVVGVLTEPGEACKTEITGFLLALPRLNGANQFPAGL